MFDSGGSLLDPVVLSHIGVKLSGEGVRCISRPGTKSGRTRDRSLEDIQGLTPKGAAPVQPSHIFNTVNCANPRAPHPSWIQPRGNLDNLKLERGKKA